MTCDGSVYVWGQPYELLKVQRIYRQELRYGLNWAKKWNDFVSSIVNGGPSGYKSPVAMGGLPAHETVNQIACGVALTAIKCESGALYMFGMNDFGQCGVGTNVLETKSALEERTVFNPRRPTGALNPLPLDFDHVAFEKKVYEKHKKGSSAGDEMYASMYNDMLHDLPPLEGQEVIDVSLGEHHEYSLYFPVFFSLPMFFCFHLKRIFSWGGCYKRWRLINMG